MKVPTMSAPSSSTRHDEPISLQEQVRNLQKEVDSLQQQVTSLTAESNRSTNELQTHFAPQARVKTLHFAGNLINAYGHKCCKSQSGQGWLHFCDEYHKLQEDLHCKLFDPPQFNATVQRLCEGFGLGSSFPAELIMRLKAEYEETFETPSWLIRPVSDRFCAEEDESSISEEERLALLLLVHNLSE